MTSELYVWDDGNGMVRFRALAEFAVDQIRYNRDHAGHVCRPIADTIDGHECYQDDPGTCGFDYGADGYTGNVVETLSKAYRWRPGMVYYESRRFETPVHGG